MTMGFVMSLAVLIVSLLGVASPAAVPLILDTDMGGGGCRDVDDVAALCMDYDGYMNMKRGMQPSLFADDCAVVFENRNDMEVGMTYMIKHL